MARLPSTHTHTPTRSPTTTAAATATAAHKNAPHRILKDPYGAHAHAIQQRLRSRRRDALAPDFDVRETESAFYLEGELPGIADRGAIRLDWIDRRTLSVDAKVEKVDLEVEWGLLRPIRVPDTPPKSVSPTLGGGGGRRGSVDTSSSGASEDGMVVDEDSAAAAVAAAQAGDDANMGIEAQPSKPVVREWLSERRCGHYQRTFTFPTDVDASAIRARLGQGLLRVLVPKVVRTGAGAKQVSIEDCE
ncbi:Heat shock protein Hsp20 [Neofusicoccum parvum]|nr:Heat shock protein Hsp20 [Neofusicoccum parvum]